MYQGFGLMYSCVLNYTQTIHQLYTKRFYKPATDNLKCSLFKEMPI